VGRLGYLEEGKSFLDYHLFILVSPVVCMVFLVEFLDIILKKLKEILCVERTMLYLEIRNNNMWVNVKVK
jgi:hypothetical protein